jgi:hypothetical protein
MPRTKKHEIPNKRRKILAVERPSKVRQAHHLEQSRRANPPAAEISMTEGKIKTPEVEDFGG